jgi:hypothetical protein
MAENPLRDPVVEEIDKIREDLAARHNYDLAEIVRELRRQQEQSGREYITFPPRQPRHRKREAAA